MVGEDGGDRDDPGHVAGQEPRHMGPSSDSEPVALAELEVAEDQFALHGRLVELQAIPTRVGGGHAPDPQPLGQGLESGGLEVPGLPVPDHDLRRRMA